MTLNTDTHNLNFSSKTGLMVYVRTAVWCGAVRRNIVRGHSSTDTNGQLTSPVNMPGMFLAWTTASANHKSSLAEN